MTARWRSRPYPARPAPARSWQFTAAIRMWMPWAPVSARARVGKVVDLLGGEKIDIVKYSENPAEFIAAALAPAEVLSVEIEDGAANSCHVTVPDTQLSLAIGNKGQNARLAAKLTGWKIDIKPESGFYEPKAEQEEETEA